MSTSSLSNPLEVSASSDKGFPIKNLFFVENRELSEKEKRYHIYIRPCSKSLVDRSRFKEILREKELVIKSTIRVGLVFTETYEIHEKWVPTPSDHARYYEEVESKGKWSVQKEGVYYREVFPKIGKFNKHNYESIKKTYSPYQGSFNGNDACCVIL